MLHHSTERWLSDHECVRVSACVLEGVKRHCGKIRDKRAGDLILRYSQYPPLQAISLALNPVFTRLSHIKQVCVRFCALTFVCVAETFKLNTGE